MWSFGVVEASPLFDQHLGLLECVEEFEVQALVSELAVKAFAITVLPGTSRFDEERL
jgi:hypothetical protein